MARHRDAVEHAYVVGQTMPPASSGTARSEWAATPVPIAWERYWHGQMLGLLLAGVDLKADRGVDFQPVRDPLLGGDLDSGIRSIFSGE